ncbi:transcription factor bHLH146 [Telopea speciosissima]|uniref:transcription factor bHLH146 n=1 Tax=Telopea speciosissima TaxID=54955 RepID=UPI001CC39B5F|nr:transcription factor bHLH146 [Telopea speciosissima]
MEGETSKRRRVYSFEPNTVLRVVFFHKYVNYLLPALSKLSKKRSSDVNEDIEHEKMVRFEVDLALVLSAESFRWSHALKHKLSKEKGVKEIQSSPITTFPNFISLLQTYKYYNGGSIIIGENIKDGITPLPLLIRSLIPNGGGNSKSSKKTKREEWRNRAKRSVKEVDDEEDDKLKCRLKTLGKLLPGGNEMGVCELLSEVESYIVCLELQVSVLQSLVDM